MNCVLKSIHETDLALTGAIGHDTLAALEGEGYIIRLIGSQMPVRGGELLVELVKGREKAVISDHKMSLKNRYSYKKVSIQEKEA